MDRDWIYNKLLKRRGNKRHNFRVWNAFMEDCFGIIETVKKEGDIIMFAPVENSHISGESLLVIGQMEELKQIVAGVRNIRQQRNISPKEELILQVVGGNDSVVTKLHAATDLLVKMGNLQKIEIVPQKDSNAASFIAGVTEIAIPLDAFINVEEELRKLEADLQYQEGFLQNVMKKLGNERFVQNAKPEIVAMERKKQADAESRIAALKESINALLKK